MNLLIFKKEETPHSFKIMGTIYLGTQCTVSHDLNV